MNRESDSPAQTSATVREGWALLESRRPHAAWATWQSVLSRNPDDAAARAALEIMAAAPDLPDVARKPLRFLPPADDAARRRWDAELRTRLASPESLPSTDPADAALAFRSLIETNPDDAEATWNLAVCQAWKGWNGSAIDTLDRFVDIACRSAPDRAADAWTLAELLRHGAGAESLADAVKLSVTVPPEIFRLGISAAELARAFGPLLLYSTQATEQAPGDHPSSSTDIAADILARPIGGPDSPAVRVRSSVVGSGETVRFSAPASPAAGLFFRELIDQWQFLLESERPAAIEFSVLPIAMLDAAAHRFRLPADLLDTPNAQRTLEAVADYFETEWIEQPRHGLGNRTPIEAAKDKSPSTRARLEGIVAFQEQLARRPGREKLYAQYEFDRLRYRLGLTTPPGRDDAKGEARHKALSLYDPEFVRTVPIGSLKPEEVVIAWKTATAVHDDPKAIELGEAIAADMPEAFAKISLERWVAPFLRRSLGGGPTARADQARLDLALAKDAELHHGRATANLLKWKAELASRLDQPTKALAAWEATCAAPDAPLVLRYEGVVDLWHLSSGLATALQFATESLSDSSNAYVSALLRKAIDFES